MSHLRSSAAKGRRSSMNTQSEALRFARERSQTKTFTAWVNKHLVLAKTSIEDLFSEFHDGVKLVALVQVLTGKELKGWSKKATHKMHALINIKVALDCLASENLRGLTTSAENIYDGDKTLILGFVWLLILHYQLSKQGDHATKGKMLSFVQDLLSDYPEYSPSNFGEGFRDGRAFCGLIHRFDPSLMDLSQVGDDARANLDRAFDAAAALDVPPLLEASDFEGVVDDLALMTYLSALLDVVQKPRVESSGPETVVQVVEDTERVSALQRQVSMSEAALEQARLDAQARLAAAEAERADRDESLAAAASELANLEDQLAAMRRERDEARAERDRKQLRVHELEAELAGAAAAQGQAAASDAEARQLREKLVALNAEARKLRVAQVQGQRELHVLAQRLKALQREANAKRAGDVAPTGRVTLVFTDVQGSTVQWEAQPDAMAAAIGTHNDCMRAQLRKHAGYEVKTEGDAFMCAFASPVDALAFCLEAQESLLEQDWPQELLPLGDSREISAAAAADNGDFALGITSDDTAADARAGGAPWLYRGLRVRMGAHVGEPRDQEDPTTGRTDYFGRMVNQSARVEGCASGGQILVSGDVWDEIKGDEEALERLGNPISTHCGTHRLKGLSNDTTLIQLSSERLSGRAFPSISMSAAKKEDKSADVEAELQRVMSTNNDLIARLNTLASDAESARAGVTRLESELSPTANVSVSHVQGELRQLQGEQKQLQSELDETREACERMMRNASARREDLLRQSSSGDADAAQRVAELSDQLASLMGEQEQLLQRYANLQQRYEDNARKLKELQLKSALWSQSQPLSGGVEAPTGRVALVFTDIQGSTVQWESDPETMATNLQLHNDIIRAQLLQHKGYEVKTEGDAFMCAFGDVMDATRFCLETQLALLRGDWTPALLENENSCIEHSETDKMIYKGYRVRMGVHLGEPRAQVDPTTGRMDYFGQMVNRSARVESVACGGQILISGDVWNHVEHRLSDLNDPIVVDCGSHRMKGLTTDTHLYQILPLQLSERTFPKISLTRKQDEVAASLAEQLKQAELENQQLQQELQRLQEETRASMERAAKLQDQLVAAAESGDTDAQLDALRKQLENANRRAMESERGLQRASAANEQLSKFIIELRLRLQELRKELEGNDTVAATPRPVESHAKLDAGRNGDPDHFRDIVLELVSTTSQMKRICTNPISFDGEVFNELIDVVVFNCTAASACISDTLVRQKIMIKESKIASMGVEVIRSANLYRKNPQDVDEENLYNTLVFNYMRFLLRLLASVQEGASHLRPSDSKDHLKAVDELVASYKRQSEAGGIRASFDRLIASAGEIQDYCRLPMPDVHIADMSRACNALLDASTRMVSATYNPWLQKQMVLLIPTLAVELDHTTALILTAQQHLSTRADGNDDDEEDVSVARATSARNGIPKLLDHLLSLSKECFNNA